MDDRPLLSEIGTAKAASNAGDIIDGIRQEVGARQKMTSVIAAVTRKSETILDTIETVGSNAADNAQSLSEADDELGMVQMALGETVGTLDDSVAKSAGILDVLDAIEARIEDVAEASRQIAGIVKQTNMLALNAMIEAQRAGSAGRGFAIVASEVKALATVTGESASGIDGMLGGLTKSGDQLRKQIEALRTELENSSNKVKATEEQALAAVNFISDTVLRASDNVDRINDQSASFADVVKTLNEIAKDNERAVASAGRTMTLATEIVSALGSGNSFLH